MFILCWSAKGGVGTTVVAAALGLLAARSAPTTVIDLGGDVPAALGVAEPSGPGVIEWLAAPAAAPPALLRLAAPAVDGLHVVHRGHPSRAPDGGLGGATPWLDTTAWDRVVQACVAGEAAGHVVVDAGAGTPPTPAHAAAGHSLLVVRPCYLALRRSTAVAELATGAVLITEPGRALVAGDVERALGIPVVAEVPWDPGVARAVDAGLLGARLPVALQRPLQHLVAERVLR